MAHPQVDPLMTPYFKDKCGVALMRHHASLDRYFFCCWVGTAGTVRYEQHGGPETYTYVLWLFRGTDQTRETIQIHDISTLSIVGAKK